MPNPFDPLEHVAEQSAEELPKVVDTWSTVLEPDYSQSIETALKMISQARNISGIRAAHKYAENEGLLDVKEPATIIYKALMTGAHIQGNLPLTIKYYNSAVEKRAVDKLTHNTMAAIRIDHLRTATPPVQTSSSRVMQALQEEIIMREKQGMENKENNPSFPSANIESLLCPPKREYCNRTQKQESRNHLVRLFNLPQPVAPSETTVVLHSFDPFATFAPFVPSAPRGRRRTFR